jgi:hypothetical protein
MPETARVRMGGVYTGREEISSFMGRLARGAGATP